MFSFFFAERTHDAHEDLGIVDVDGGARVGLDLLDNVPDACGVG